MMKTEYLFFAILFLVLAFKNSCVISENHSSANSRQFRRQPTATVNDEIVVEEQRNGNLMSYPDLVGHLLHFHQNNAHNKGAAMEKHFRPVRRSSSELLDKRSVGMQSSEEMEDFVPVKRALGSEFLGKRKIGSEFLGKRKDSDFNDESRERSGSHWVRQQHEPQSFDMMMNMEKRRLGSEFLGKRRPDLYDWLWKRGRIGSEFLGKRSSSPAGNEVGQQEEAAVDENEPREMSQALNDVGPLSRMYPD